MDKRRKKSPQPANGVVGHSLLKVEQGLKRRMVLPNSRNLHNFMWERSREEKSEQADGGHESDSQPSEDGKLEARINNLSEWRNKAASRGHKSGYFLPEKPVRRTRVKVLSINRGRIEH